jgi:hypothetical protein
VLPLLTVDLNTNRMDLTKKKKPPNPNGNPNFKKRWSNFSAPVHVRIPAELHSLFKDLTTAISSGKIKITDLENMCIDWQNVEHQMTAITGKTTLSIAPSPETSKPELLEKVIKQKTCDGGKTTTTSIEESIFYE